jgi:hypothetical protein
MEPDRLAKGQRVKGWALVAAVNVAAGVVAEARAAKGAVVVSAAVGVKVG